MRPLSISELRASSIESLSRPAFSQLLVIKSQGAPFSPSIFFIVSRTVFSISAKLSSSSLVSSLGSISFFSIISCSFSSSSYFSSFSSVIRSGSVSLLGLRY